SPGGTHERSALPPAKYAVLPEELTFDSDAHITGSTFNLPHCAFQINRVEIGHLDLSDFLNLPASQLAHFVLIGGSRTFFDPGSLLDEESGGWALQDELERSIAKDCNFCRNDLAHAVGSASVIFLAKGHQVDAVLRQGRADWGRGIGFACV